MKTKQPRHPISLILMLALATAQLALGSASPRATPPLAPATLGEVLTLSSTVDTQGLPAVAWNPACDIFLVVWQDRRNGVDDDIWGRYVSGTGEALASGEFNLTPDRAGHQRAPAVAYQPQFDRFLVVWMDDQAGNWDIYGQYFNCQKQPTSDLIAISTRPEPQQYPDVACRYGLAWVVWHDQRNGNWDIYGQRVDSGGGLIGDNLFISNQASDQSYPAIAANPQDTGCTLQSFLVTWRDFRNSGASSLDIYDQQLSNDGRCGLNRALYTEARAQSFPDLDYGTTDDRYLAVWQDDRAGATAWDIYGRRVLPNGLPDGEAFAISTAGHNQWLPAVAYNSNDNEFLVVWQDYRNGASWNIGGQRVSGAGALLGINFPVAATSGDELNPAVAYGATAGHYLVVWSQGGDLFGRACWP
jgi:hypothetical protein